MLDNDLDTLNDHLYRHGAMCEPFQNVAENYRKGIERLSKKKPVQAKVYFRYVVDPKGELVLDCTFKVNGMFFGFFTVRRCAGTEKWSKTGCYHLTTMFGGGHLDYDHGAIQGLAQAKALATLNTRILLAALQNVTLA